MKMFQSVGGAIRLLGEGSPAMTIKYVTGDLFVNRHQAEALAHGCNCQGAMGAGIAVGFRERYPRMYEEYLLITA
jgi:O-acetyl-ADP-ribose deacetylase (regulator of RNase III)